MKRAIAAILAVLMIFTMLPLSAIAAGIDTASASTSDTSSQTNSTQTDTWDGKAAASFASGSGTEQDPYIIRTAEQLAYFATVVNNGSLSNINVALANNIDLSGYSWTPIGDFSYSFKGIFNGNGYTISGLEITSSTNLAGLFGYNEGTIKNLNVITYNVNISYSNNDLFIGAVAGQNAGYILDVEVSGNIVAKNASSSTVRVWCGGITGCNTNTIGRSSYNGDINVVSNGSFMVGGISGDNQATIYSSFSKGNITATKSSSSGSYVFCVAGGLSGANQGTIKNCYSTLNVTTTVTAGESNSIAGGLVGEARSDASYILNCYALGTVSANSSNGVCADAGGLIGYARGNIANSFANNTVKALTNNQCNANAGKIIGYNASCTIEKTYVSSSSVVERTYSYETGGCNSTTKWDITGANCSGETGNYSYSKAFITDTLGWGKYISVSDHISNTSNTWVIGDAAPTLHIESIYSLTVTYHKDNLISNVAFFWKNADEQYKIVTPEHTGYTPNKASVSGSMFEDTIIDVSYEKNYHYLKINYKSSDGKSLGSYSGRFGYGDEYNIAIPEQTGYTAQQDKISGIMMDSDITVDAIYNANQYVLTVKYVYSDTNTTASDTKTVNVKYGEPYNVPSPAIDGYSVSQDTVSGTMPAADKEVVVYYGTNTYKVSIVHQYENGEVINTDSYTLAYGTSFSYDAIQIDGYTPDKTAVSGRVMGDNTYYITYSPNTYKLVIEYQYASNGTIASESYSGEYKFGEKYSVSSPVIAGYTVSKATVSGTMPSCDVKETVTYGKNMYTVDITYQYSDGTLIKEDIIKVEYGTEYSIISPTIKWYTPDKSVVSGTMPAYEVSETVVYTRNVINGGSGKCGDSVNWILYEDGTLSITGNGKIYDYEHASAPWYALRGNITHIVIDNGVTSIGDNAFADCSDVKDCRIPESITSIGEKAFWGCSTITDIVLPSSVTSIGKGAFSNCEKLSAMSVASGNQNFIVENGVLLNAAKDKIITYPMGVYDNSYIVPNGIITIEAFAFYGNPYLQKIELPISLNYIGESAFENCSRISKVHLTSTSISIGDKAFKNSGIDTLIVDGKITDLGNYAFASANIRAAYFKSDVPVNVGDYVFGNETAIMERLCVYYPLENESWIEAIDVTSDGTGYKSEYWRSYHAYAFNGILDVTFENAGGEQIYATFIYCDKTPISGVEVTFNGVTKITDKDGFAYFVYKDVNKVDLIIHKDGYYSAYEASNAYVLKSIGVDYFNLTTNSTVEGISCYGNNITSDIGYINVKYTGLIPIIVQGTTEFDITKMELVQEVKDAKDPSSGTVIKKVLQTVYSGDENLSSDGRCRFMVDASAFSFNINEDYPIYVYMHTNSGEDAVVSKLNIRTISFKFSGEFGNLFGDVNLKLSDTGVAFLDGISLKLKSPVDCPLSFQVVNNEIYVTWDMDEYLNDALSKMGTEVEGQDNLKDAISDTNTRVKEYMGSLADKADAKIKDNKILNKHKHSSDFSLETSMAGGLCIVMGEENNVQTVRSYLKLAIELKASWTADYVIVFVPITIEVKATASGEVEIMGLGFDAQKCEVLLPDYTITTEASVQLSLGLGCRVISAGVFGRLKLKSTIVIGEITYFDGLVLSGEYGIYAKLNLGLFSLYGEKSWKFMEVELIPKAQAAMLLLDESETGYLGDYNGVPVYDVSAYALDTPSVDIGDVKWTTDMSQEIEDKSYEYANAQLIEHNDTVIVMYLTVNDFRNSYNAQTLVYRIYDELTGTWSEAIPVDNNGTGDSSFTFAEYNGNLYIAYTESKTEFSEEYASSLTDTQMIIETSLSQEVVIAKYDETTKKFIDFENLSNNNYYDSLPNLEVVGNVMTLSWVTNHSKDDSLVFGMNSNNNVNIRHYDGSKWSNVETILSDCNPISEMIIAELAGEAYIAMIIDEDANYYTTDDSNIYLVNMGGEIAFIDCYGQPIGNLQTCLSHYGKTLVWYCGGGLSYISSSDMTPKMLVDAETGITEDFKIVNLSDDILSLTWAVKGVNASGEGVETSNIHGMFMDNTEQWTKPSVVLQVPYYLMNYDLVSDDGDMRFVFTNTNMVVNSETGTTSMYSKLCSHFLTTGYSFEVGEITNVNINNELGKVTMDVEMSNTGVKTIKQVSVVIKQYYTDSFEIKAYYPVGLFNINLLSGEVRNVPFETEIISELDLNNADVIVEVFEGDEQAFDEYVAKLNQTLEWNGLDGGIKVESMGSVMAGASSVVTPIEYRTDLQIEGEYIIIGQTEYISLKVTNVGTLSASGMLNVVRLYGDNNEYSESVYTANIIDLPAQGIKYYLVELKKDFFESTYETFDCWISHCELDENLENNSLTVTAKKLENAPGTELDDKATASELSSYNEVFDKYSSDDLKLTIKLNGNQFVGIGDTVANENTSYIPNQDGTELNLTMSKDYLRTLDVGFYEFMFLFLTENGYIDCVLNVTVEDLTPIDVVGTISIVGTPKRGEKLSVDISSLNTDELSYAWSIDGKIVSTEKEYEIGNDDLGKWITVTVAGTGLYQGVVQSTSIYIDKVNRTISAPKLEAGSTEYKISIRNGFVVGDGVVEYGWATSNNANSVKNWSVEKEITFSDAGMYYVFARITGSEIYQDVTSAPTAYGIGYSLITWNVNGNITEKVYADGETPVYVGDIYKNADDTATYRFAGWDQDGNGTVDIPANSQLPVVCGNSLYEAVYEETLATLDNSLNVKGSTLSIQSDISINYYISLAALEQYDKYYMIFAKDVYNSDGSKSIEYVTVQQYTISGNYAIFSFDGIAAKELNDNVYAIAYAEKDGQLYMSKTDIYSVATYAYNRIANSNDAKMVELSISLLNYGAMAQKYFEYNINNLANSRLTKEQQVLATQDISLTSVKEYITPENAKVLFTGSSLTLEDKVAINYYFNIEAFIGAGYNLNDLSLVIKYGDNTEVITADKFILSSSNGYYVSFDKLAAKDMSVVCEATFWMNYGDDSQSIVGETMIYSIESYAQNKQNSSDEALVAMMKAMMHYGAAASAYANGN